MDAGEALTHALGRAGAGDRYVADGVARCRYAEIPEITTAVDRHLLACGVEYDKGLAVRCPNSVPAALLLLVLLQRRACAVLLPPAEGPTPQGGLTPIPSFCQYSLTVHPLRAAPDESGLRCPEQYLSVERHGSAVEAARPGQPAGLGASLCFRTSGSMGASKIVVHTQANVIGNAGNCVTRYGFTDADRVFLPVPICHSYGFGTGFLPAVLAGSSLLLQDRSNVPRFLDAERTFRPTLAVVTPTLCELVLRGKQTPTPYKVVVTSGQRIRGDVFRAFDALCGHSLVNQYGSTELGAVASCRPEDPADLRGGTIGRPMTGVELRLETTADGQQEICCRHPYGFAGWVSESGAWLSRVGEWHRTGDIGRRRDDGLLEVGGRTDDCINRSGYLVLPSDIERAMEALDGLAQVAVIVTAAESIQGQHLLACCVAREGRHLTEWQLRSDVTRLLPPYAVPDEVLLVGRLPVLPNGKLDRQMLRGWAETRLAGGARDGG